jgi:hypothetical protein
VADAPHGLGGKCTTRGPQVRNGVEGIQALPGVNAAAAACCLPLETVWQLPLIVVGRALDGPYHRFGGWTFISPGYFDVFNIPILRGRVG